MEILIGMQNEHETLACGWRFLFQYKFRHTFIR